MNHFRRVPRFAVALAVLGGLGSTGQPISAAAATWPSVDCRMSVQSSGIRVAVCDRTRSSTTTCSLIPLPAAPAAYLQRLPTSRGQRWAVIDCPGRYPFGGVTLIPDGDRTAL